MKRFVTDSRNIYLTGMPGAGKSTLGKALAAELGRNYLDLDDVIEEQMDMSVSSIFSELGESQFRIAERRALESLLNEKDLVIAVGGGAPCFFENMKKMKANGITLFLDPPREVLVERISKDLKERPKLAGSSSLIDLLRKTYEERKEFYEQAHYRLTLSNPGVDDLLLLLKGESEG